MSDQPKAAKGTAVLLLSQLVIMGSGYVIAMLLARSLGPAVYGAYGIVYSVLLSVELIGRLGFPQAVSKLVAEREDDAGRLEATGVTMALVVYGSIFLIFLACAPLLGQLFNVEDGAWLFRLAALDIPFYGLYFMLVHILTGRRRFKEQAIAASLYSVTKALGIVVLVLVGPSIEGALLINVLGSVIALAIVAWQVGAGPFRLTVVDLRPIFALAVPVAIIALGTQILISVDLWVLNALGTGIDDAVKGFYVAASNVARIPNVIAFAVTSVMVPTVARALARGSPDEAGEAVGGCLRFMTIALIPGCTLIAVDARAILSLLFSSDYAGGAFLLIPLVFAQGLFYTFFMSFANVLMAANRPYASAILAFAMLVLSIAASAVGVVLFGALGAALGALLATAVAATLVVGMVVRTVRPVVDLASLPRILLATLLGACVAGYWPATGLMLFVELALACTVTLAVLLLTQVVRVEELASFLPGPLRRLAMRAVA